MVQTVYRCCPLIKSVCAVSNLCSWYVLPHASQQHRVDSARLGVRPRGGVAVRPGWSNFYRSFKYLVDRNLYP